MRGRGALLLLGAIAALAAAELALPELLNRYYLTILVRILVAVLAATSLQLVNGFTGQFSIGHAGFMAVGVPSLRLRGDYLAIATLGFGEIIRIAILNIDAVGGARGFSLSAPAGVDLRYEGIGEIGAVVALSMFVMARLVYASGGLAFRAVREDETAAEAMGIPTTRVKVEAFVVASFFAGVAGALFAHAEGYVHTNSFGFVRSFEIVVFVVLGGLGSFTGAALAAAVLTAAPELLRGLGEWRMILYSILIIVTMILRPQGLMGSRELSLRWLRRRPAAVAGGAA